MIRFHAQTSIEYFSKVGPGMSCCLLDGSSWTRLSDCGELIFDDFGIRLASWCQRPYSWNFVREKKYFKITSQFGLWAQVGAKLQKQHKAHYYLLQKCITLWIHTSNSNCNVISAFLLFDLIGEIFSINVRTIFPLGSDMWCWWLMTRNDKVFTQSTFLSPKFFGQPKHLEGSQYEAYTEHSYGPEKIESENGPCWIETTHRTMNILIQVSNVFSH